MRLFELDKSQVWLADEMSLKTKTKREITTSRISSWCLNKTQPNVFLLKEVAKFLKCTMESLIED